MLAYMHIALNKLDVLPVTQFQMVAFVVLRNPFLVMPVVQQIIMQGFLVLFFELFIRPSLT